MRFKVVTITRLNYKSMEEYLDGFEDALNEPPQGYKVHSWNFVPGFEAHLEGDKTRYHLGMYTIVYEQLPEPVVINKKERKFKEIDE
jgi:hypothetical protein